MTASALVVLDEPNSNLDAAGDQALAEAIVALKQAGTTVVVMVHRPSAIAAVDKLLILRDGKIDAFGPKQEVLTQVTRPIASTPIPKAATFNQSASPCPEIGQPHSSR